MTRRTWLPRLLFLLACTPAVGLLLLTLLAPRLPSEEPRPAEGTSVFALFAHDPAVRRTALASALGLLVTACVFFRPRAASPGGEPEGPTPPGEEPALHSRPRRRGSGVGA